MELNKAAWLDIIALNELLLDEGDFVPMHRDILEECKDDAERLAVHSMEVDWAERAMQALLDQGAAFVAKVHDTSEYELLAEAFESQEYKSSYELVCDCDISEWLDRSAPDLHDGVDWYLTPNREAFCCELFCRRRFIRVIFHMLPPALSEWASRDPDGFAEELDLEALYEHKDTNWCYGTNALLFEDPFRTNALTGQ